MLRLLKIFLITIFFFCNETLHAQNNRMVEFFRSHSDEILVVTVANEDIPLAQSLGICKSDVTVNILSFLKATRLSGDVKKISFGRLRSCAKVAWCCDVELLSLEKKYIVFLNTEHPSSYQKKGEPPRTIYSLADDALGIQEYTTELASSLQARGSDKR